MNQTLVNLKKGTSSFFKSSKGEILLISLQIALVFSVVMIGTGYADTFDNITKLISTWAKRVGGVVALIGGIDFGFGWKNDDPSERIRGLKTFVSGCIVVAVSVAYATWIV